MKYIMFTQTIGEGTVRQVPILFPNSLTHSLVAEALLQSPELVGAAVTSAGEFSSMSLSDVELHGKSDSLKLESLSTDSAVLPMNDYLHGM
jgi:hypothetical protein